MDLLALAAFVLMTATGLVLAYRLPEGSGGLGGGTGRGAAERPVVLVLGLTRHAWGDLHFGTAVVLFVALATHLYLHFGWFKALLRRPGAAGGDPARAMLGAVGLVALLGAAAVPLLAPRAVVPRGEVTGAGTAEAPWVAFHGGTTLGEAAARAGVAPEALAGALGLPPDTPPATRLGRPARGTSGLGRAGRATGGPEAASGR